MTILALHGFMGSADDWQEFQDLMSIRDHDSIQWVTPSLFSGGFNLSSFDTIVEQLRLSLLKPGTSKFIGYSLGGRIGLHWLDKYPNDFDQWFFLSTHSGLNTDQEQMQREASDKLWAQSLRDFSPSEFLKLWNAQGIFQSTKASPNPITTLNKASLLHGLRELSLSRQKNFASVLERYQEKVHWVIGEKDRKFLDLAQKLKKDGKISHLHILNGGHRIYLDQPQEIINLLVANSAP